MGGVSGKIDAKAIAARARALGAKIMDEVEVAAHGAGRRGEEQYEAMLFAAETRTGEERVEFGLGPFAGRVETGDLIESTGYEVERDGDRRVSLRYGAINSPPDYARIQLLGGIADGHEIPAAIDPLDSERDVKGEGKDRNVRDLLMDIRRIAAKKWSA